MTDFKVNGLVIRESDHKDNDKILTVLTEKYGKLFVIGKGVKSLKNRHMACTQLFSYASFNLRKRGNFYYITDSDLIENYYEIRNDIVKLALSTYICDVLCEVSRGGIEESGVMKLALNTFYAIAKDIKSLELIRSAFEMKLASECGFMPDLECCSVCGKDNELFVSIDIMGGNYICDKCKSSALFTTVKDAFYETNTAKPILYVSSSVIQAMKYVCASRLERFLSFSLDKSECPSFFDACEKYLLNHLERGFYSLEFYKSLL